MIKKEDKRLFGLLGKNIEYSFSRGYFANKFTNENIGNCHYTNFDIPTITDFPRIIKTNPNIVGLNVTIPYKQEVIPFLDELHSEAESIGAVNTIKVFKDGTLKGFNTDVIGFRQSLETIVKQHHQKALILGTGGASKAVKAALQQLNIAYAQVSRTSSNNTLLYADITKELLNEYSIIINCTPLGTHPNIEACPKIPYQYITKQHLLYDLIYNPSLTTFLKRGKERGALIKNGLEMLQLQAEASWKIWNKL